MSQYPWKPVPGPQWTTADGRPPPGTHVNHILVIGPEDIDDPKIVYQTLNEYTLRMEAVHIHTLSEGKYQTIKLQSGNKALAACGVSSWAKFWAELSWWPRSINNPEWWGKGDRGYRLMLKAVFAALGPKGHCVAFWDKHDKDVKALLEPTRTLVGYKRFHLVRIK